MTVFDYAVLIVIGLSVLLSVIRGLVREVLALLAWVIAFLAAHLLAGDFAALMPAEFSNAEMRVVVSFAAVFLGVLLMMSLVAVLASKLVKKAGLGVEDCVLGGAFGLARGALVVMALVLAAGLTSLPREPVWRDAALSRPLESLAEHVKAWLPGGLAQRINYR